ncbi:unnamed protein product [Linum tenue]|uniref:BHLH domain-containing protein n=1 Tax=Linum tenue TaxID=586396 RepID=A0AAV0QBZ3_9ROSI|nr:unnamed protein product [Linum tenue]
MERLLHLHQGPISHNDNPPCFAGDPYLECLEQQIATTAASFRFQERGEEREAVLVQTAEEEEEERQLYPASSPSLDDDTMPFLQMLQTVDNYGTTSPGRPPFPFFSFREPNFQTLLKLQHLKKLPWDVNNNFSSSSFGCFDSAEIDQQQPQLVPQSQMIELESCNVTHDYPSFVDSPVKSETRELPHHHSSSCPEGVSPAGGERAAGQDRTVDPPNPSSAPLLPWSATNTEEATRNSAKPAADGSSTATKKERRKRKRTRAAKNKEEVESQRMTHITVERNRRRQMNEHLNSLRSLMPPSYVQRVVFSIPSFECSHLSPIMQRNCTDEILGIFFSKKGDQASIIGGAIDFVKELEQLLQCLEAQKRIRRDAAAAAVCEEEFAAAPSSEAAEIEVTAIQNHVNLKVKCERRGRGGTRGRQLVRAIVALEELCLTVLHLNISSSASTAFYSFNLKIEEECKLGSADEVAAAVHQIFSSIING